MDPTWIIIIGLGFDIVGAIFIISPLLTLVKRTWGNLNPEKESLRDDMLGQFWGDKRIQRLAWIGIVLLSMGFGLQMVGNYFQNPPSF